MLAVLRSITRHWSRLRPFLVLAGALTVLLSLVRWGGSARTGPLFWLGVTVFTTLIVVFGGAIAWLFSGPRPVIARLTARQVEQRQVIAVLTLISSTFIMIGLYVDELWHRVWGGFGDDFLWPPHLMIYGSPALFALFAGGGILVSLRRAGTLAERLRTDAPLSLLALVAAFLVISAPSDELWHRIYGKDLTAWSLPHLSLAGGIMLITLAGASVALSLTPRPPRWSAPWRLDLASVLALLLLTIMTLVALQFGTTEWEGLRGPVAPGDAFRSAFWQRPLWVYPAVVAAIALFASTAALHALQRWGGATLVALAVLGLRAAGLAALRGTAERFDLGLTSHLLLLAPAITLDCWYALRRRAADSLATLVIGNALAGAAFVLAGLPLIDPTMLYPPVNARTAPAMVGMSLLLVLAGGWAGARLGGWLGTLEHPQRAAPLTRRATWLSLGGLAIAGTLVLAIMLLARPPAEPTSQLPPLVPQALR